MKEQNKEQIKSACDQQQSVDANGKVSDHKDEEVQERRERVLKVAKVLEGIKYKTETEKANAIVSFAKSPLTIEEIAQIMAPGKPGPGVM
jgi:hypothetical protein